MKKKIKIGAITYSVKLKHVDGAMGITVYNRSEIRINKGMEEMITLETLVHELLHVAWMQAGHADKVDEGLIDGVAYVLLDSGVMDIKKLKRLLYEYP
jgi:hypothetical protein